MVLTLVDRDDDDGHRLKRSMKQHAAVAGLITRSRAVHGGWNVLNRIVIEELQAWYCGGWQAVRKAYLPGLPHA